LKNTVYNRICDAVQCGTVVACLFVYGLFNDAILTNNVQHTFVEWRCLINWTDLELSGRDVIGGMTGIFPVGTEENHENPHSEYPIFEPW